MWNRRICGFLAVLLVSMMMCRVGAVTVSWDSDKALLVDGIRTFVYGFYREPGGDVLDFGGAVDAQAGLVVSPWFFESLASGYDSGDIAGVISAAGGHLAAAESAGVGVGLAIPEELLWGQDMTALGQYVNGLKGSGALWFWVLCDTPSGQVSPQGALQAAYNQIKSLDGGHPVVIIEGREALAGTPSLGTYCDVLWVRSHHIPLSTIAIARDLAAVQGQFSSKPVWPMAQGYDNLAMMDRSGMNPASIKVRDGVSSMTAFAARTQAHATLSAGAKAIVYEIAPPDKHDIRNDTPALWAGMVSLGQELQELEGALLSGASVPSFSITDLNWGIVLRIRDLYGNANVTPGPGIPSSVPHVLTWKRMYGGHLYMGFAAEYLPLNRMRMILPSEFSEISQYPGGGAIITATTGNPTIQYDEIPVAIWNVVDNQEIEFVIKEAGSWVIEVAY